MKYETMFMLSIGIISILSLAILNYSLQTVTAWDCTWVVQWDELVPVCEPERELLIKLAPDKGQIGSYNNNHIIMDAQPLPSATNLVINTDNLNFTQAIKITNLGNGTTLINVVNATN